MYLVDYNARANHQLYRVVGGVGTPIGGGWTTPAANGDVVRLEATGTTIRVLVNGVQKLSVTDTGVTGGAPGIYAFAAAGEQVQLDTFAAASAGAMVPRGGVSGVSRRDAGDDDGEHHVCGHGAAADHAL